MIKKKEVISHQHDTRTSMVLLPHHLLFSRFTPYLRRLKKWPRGVFFVNLRISLIPITLENNLQKVQKQPLSLFLSPLYFSLPRAVVFDFRIAEYIYNLLNKRSEIFGTCPHRKKHLLQNSDRSNEENSA